MILTNKPANWETTPEMTGEFLTLPAGGYVCKIVNAEESETSTGKECLILRIDISEGEYQNFFTNQYQNDTRQTPLWPNGGIYRQITEGSSLGFFKGMISAIEKSNKGYKWDWNPESLKNKLVGIIFQKEEYLGNDGTYKWSTKPRFVRTVDKILSGDFIILGWFV